MTRRHRLDKVSHFELSNLSTTARDPNNVDHFTEPGNARILLQRDKFYLPPRSLKILMNIIFYCPTLWIISAPLPPSVNPNASRVSITP